MYYKIQSYQRTGFMRAHLLIFLTALLSATSAQNRIDFKYLRGSSRSPTTVQHGDSFTQKVVLASGMTNLDNSIKNRLCALNENQNTEKALRSLARHVIDKTKEALKNSHTLQSTFKDASFLVDVAIASLYDEKVQSIFSFLKNLISSNKPISSHPVFGNPDMSNFRINRVTRSALTAWLTTKEKQQKSLKELCDRLECDSPSKLANTLDTLIHSLDSKAPSKRNPMKSIKGLISRIGEINQKNSKKP